MYHLLWDFSDFSGLERGPYIPSTNLKFSIVIVVVVTGVVAGLEHGPYIPFTDLKFSIVIVVVVSGVSLADELRGLGSSPAWSWVPKPTISKIQAVARQRHYSLSSH